MSRHIVSTTVTTSITLGAGGYGDGLTVTSTGAVEPSAYGATAIDAPSTRSTASILNQGSVIGGRGNPSGSSGIDGGIGIDLASAGRVNNQGVISGGAGGYEDTSSYRGGNGGVGLLLESSGRISNSGTITGGNGGRSTMGTGGGGGNGVDLSAGVTLHNAGTILAGNVGSGYYPGGRAAVGVLLQGDGTIDNTGVIAGGYGGFFYMGHGYFGRGGDAVVMTNGGTLVNHGTIEATYPTGNRPAYSAAAVSASDGGTIDNFGNLTGGSGASGGGVGGEGLSLGGSGKIVNSGTIHGGAGGYSGYRGRSGGNGGTGVDFGAGSILVNHGTIAGGIGGASSGVYSAGVGGIGVAFSGGTLTNTGTITGGASSGPTYGITANGGIGAIMSGGTATNFGLITGGAVGSSSSKHANTTTGGTGFDIEQGGTLTNSGTIIGGAGGSGGAGIGGAGGAGVYLNGGTLLTSGTISGGAGGQGKGGAGAQGDAVQFGTLAATLDVTGHAIFNGDIVANAGVNDRLELGGEVGTLTGFGSTITGFTSITEDSNAHWRLDGTISGAGSLQLGSGGTLVLDGNVSIAHLAFAGPGELKLVQPHAFSSVIAGFGAQDVINLRGIDATSLSYAAGTLTLTDATSTVDTLTFTGQYTTADFTLTSHGNGVLVGFAGPAASSHSGGEVASSETRLSAYHDALPVLWHAHV